jgi:hypothetical protein
MWIKQFSLETLIDMLSDFPFDDEESVSFSGI